MIERFFAFMSFFYSMGFYKVDFTAPIYYTFLYEKFKGTAGKYGIYLSRKRR